MLLLNRRIAPAIRKACFRQMKAGFWVHSSAPCILKNCTLHFEYQYFIFCVATPFLLKKT